MPRVMISYRNISGQRDFAFALEKALTQAGIETWLDVKDIPRLSRWEDEIFKGIIGSDYVVLCLSPEYFQSETCLFECYVARGYSKTILPLIVSAETMESIFKLVSQYEGTRGLEHINFVDFRVQTTEEIAAKTQRVIKAIVNPTPPNIDYDVFISYRTSQATFALQVADDLLQAGIKTYIDRRSLDVGADWRRVAWSAILRSEIHIVILAPDVADSEYIKNEVLVTRTKKPARFLPILAEAFRGNEEARSIIHTTFSTSKNLSVLNDIQWFVPHEQYPVFIDNLISDIRAILSQKAD